jgi:hypothetical protein
MLDTANSIISALWLASQIVPWSSAEISHDCASDSDTKGMN